jgi:death-on-curing protein
MSEPTWLSRELVVAIHGEQLQEFGGPAGLRDQGMLESALGRPRNKWSFGEEDLATLAAAYAFGIARNHPFVDGNKRAALLSLITFLGLNGIEFAASNAEAAVMIQGIASGEVTEEGLTRWIRDNWPETAATKPTKATTKRAAKPAPKSAPTKRR